MFFQSYHGIDQFSFGPDTTFILFPHLHVIGLYAVYFFFGVGYYECHDSENVLTKHWLPCLVLAILSFPFALDFVFYENQMGVAELIPMNFYRPLGVLLQVLFSWWMIFGLMGLFKTFFSKQSALITLHSDASYWMYIAHLPLCMALQSLIVKLEMNAFMKFGMICLLMYAILMISYIYMVRYTWVGSLLHGRKVKETGIKV